LIKTPRVALVVAVAENGVIGRRGKLPWRLPSDLKRFRQLTLGKPMIMGRKTYQSIGRPLDGRDSIVLSARREGYPAGVHVAASIKEALALAARLAGVRGVEEVAVIGGAEVFAAALPFVERIYLTLVHANPAGDRRLSPFPPDAWREVAREEMHRRSDDEFAADFMVLERRGAAAAP
jgi:dihydrofolate reductase